MPKDIAQPVNPPSGSKRNTDNDGSNPQPLSGSKRVKQANHTRHNNGEG
jgi:small acid-soluble spore protein P (minor)